MSSLELRCPRPPLRRCPLCDQHPALRTQHDVRHSRPSAASPRIPGLDFCDTRGQSNSLNVIIRVSVRAHWSHRAPRPWLVLHAYISLRDMAGNLDRLQTRLWSWESCIPAINFTSKDKLVSFLLQCPHHQNGASLCITTFCIL